ncbi:prolipoprotein diacylglyceryl transferase, partial [Pseudomonas viridiflava]|uniref:prolipoprotein diacylglyceryl transferase n=1 Tax=Pseudomonas viridiflava TaxID=33069 RepID=UPI0019818F28
AIPLGIIGARIFHVLTHPGDYFYPGADLLRTLYIWEGGIASFGSLLGGAVGAYIGCRMTGIRFWAFADALAPGLLLAQAFGRLGNYFNHELY